MKAVFPPTLEATLTRLLELRQIADMSNPPVRVEDIPDWINASRSKEQRQARKMLTYALLYSNTGPVVRSRAVRYPCYEKRDAILAVLRHSRRRMRVEEIYEQLKDFKGYPFSRQIVRNHLQTMWCLGQVEKELVKEGAPCRAYWYVKEESE